MVWCRVHEVGFFFKARAARFSNEKHVQFIPDFNRVSALTSETRTALTLPGDR
jgi:hypothetical protein